MKHAPVVIPTIASVRPIGWASRIMTQILSLTIDELYCPDIDNSDTSQFCHTEMMRTFNKLVSLLKT